MDQRNSVGRTILARWRRWKYSGRVPNRQWAPLSEGTENMGSDPQASGSDSKGDQRTPAPHIRVGVLGVGYWGSKQLRVMRSTPGVSRVVAIDARLPLLSGMAHLLATGEGFTSLEAALPHL